MKQLKTIGLIVVTAGTVLIGAGDPASAQAVLSAQKPPLTATPEGRLLIGRGKDYVPSAVDPQALFVELEGSMKKRRDFAWTVVDQLLQPVKIKLLDGVTEVDVPLWRTWYEGVPAPDPTTGDPVPGSFSELAPIFRLYFTKLKPVLAANPNADVGPVIKDTMKEFSTKDLSSSLTNAQLSNVLHQHVVSGMLGPLLGQGFTMFSPSFVEHMMKESRGIDRCTFNVSNANEPPPSPTEFSPCMKEFPRSAVIIKASWKRLSDPAGVLVHDTSPPAMKALMEEGTWPGLSHPKKPTAVHPDRTQIYTNITQEGQEWGLAGVHFVTKDVREWVWVSLWWDPDASKDFGADRPAQSAVLNNGVWKNYKMCATASFDERDSAPWSHYSGNQQTLGASIKAVHDGIVDQIKNGTKAALGQPSTFPMLPNALGPWAAPHNSPTTWCSNPNVETHPGNGRTSCIGCHQIAFTRNEARNAKAQFFQTMWGDYPQFGRSKVRNNFPAEFAWSFEFEYKGTIAKTKNDAGFQWPN
ncbi:MAG TPA: hypothetical protein VF601_06485 [Beijerinckiaceae bacterium]|jgi:hypothetical protein